MEDNSVIIIHNSCFQVKKSLVTLSSSQKLKVRATDNGNPKLHSDGYVEIKVGTSGGGKTFKFREATYGVALDEDARTNSEVGCCIIMFFSSTTVYFIIICLQFSMVFLQSCLLMNN